MKTYFGTYLPGVADHKVAVRDDETGETLPLRHHVRHSPAGFNWGYGGSGPSELARCILIDHLVPDDWRELIVNDYDRLVPSYLYQQFKADVVAQWPMNRGWELTSDELDNWLKAKGVGHERMAS
jgi:hypothetical protein